MHTLGKLIVVTGPSGVGKRTLIEHVLENVPNCWFSVSATTRAPRPGETHGKDYYFIDMKAFRSHIDAGDFFEWAEFAGNLYGTPKDFILEKLSKGTTVLAEIEIEGAKQVKEKMPEAETIFILPAEPAFDTLRKRILGRGDVSKESMELRLETARTELAQKDFFDHRVVNDDLETAKGEMLSLVRSLLEGSRRAA